MPHPEPDAANTRLWAIALVCGAGLFFALLDTSVKYLALTTDMPLAQIVWVRFVGHAVLSVAMLGPHRIASLTRTTKPVVQWLRSGLMLSATVCNFVAVTYLRLDQTATIFFLTPLVVAALAGPLLGEWIGWRRLVAVLAGFLGIVVVMRPGFGWIHWAAIFSFGAMLSYALYNIATRYLSHHDTSGVTQFYTPLAGLLLMAPWALLNWVWPATSLDWVLLVWLGAAGAIGHWLFIQAALRAPAPVIAPFIYVNLIWMASLGFVVFGDVPDLATLAGGAIVVGSGLYLLYRERRRRA
jgi:drug/metabolite transporter (DMT)-like permease